MDGEMLPIICAALPGPEARADVCLVVALGTLPLTGRGRLCLCLWLTSCLHLYVHHLMRSCLLFVCAYVLALSPGTALTQSASVLVPEGADGGAARAPPCPPNTRSC